MTDPIDRYLTTVLRCVWHGALPPPWPSGWAATQVFCDDVFDRISFHGLALIYHGQRHLLADWPEALISRLGQEARLQSFWEMGHREVLNRLIRVLQDAGAASCLIKGTALAYSAYPEPSLRRRGDSDLLISGAARASVRRALAVAGFQLSGEALPLQESWTSECTMGFLHIFDLHWRINSSAALALRLENALIGTRSVPLLRLSDTARAIAPADNLVLVSINRASHAIFGYRSGHDKVFNHDRLIWALDCDLQSKQFSASDWDSLLAVAALSGTAPLVLSALDFAARALGTVIPPQVRQALASQPGDPLLLEYFGNLTGLDRLRRDLAASPALRDKVRLVHYTLFPDAEVLHDRYPDAVNWPLPVLRARRLVESLGQLLWRRA